jgi:hypothetical protein
MRSRKFWLTLVALVLMVVVGYVSPDFPAHVLDHMVVLVLGWAGIQGAREIVQEARRRAPTGVPDDTPGRS